MEGDRVFVESDGEITRQEICRRGTNVKQSQKRVRGASYNLVGHVRVSPKTGFLGAVNFTEYADIRAVAGLS